MSDVTKHIGSRIRLYRKLLGLTIDDLADGIHKSKSTVSKYETGSVSIDAETLFDIAGILRVPVSKLVDYDTGRVDRSGSPLPPRDFLTVPANTTCTISATREKSLNPLYSFTFPYPKEMIFQWNYIMIWLTMKICSAAASITAVPFPSPISIPTWYSAIRSMYRKRPLS